MTRLYGGTLLFAAAFHVAAAAGPQGVRGGALVAGQACMLIGIWGLGFIAIPQARRLGWAMIGAGLASSALLIAGMALARGPLAPIGSVATTTILGDVAVGGIIVFLLAAGSSFLRAPGSWRVIGGLFLAAAGAIPLTGLAVTVLAGSLDQLMATLRVGVGIAVLCYACAVGWSGVLLWRAGG